MKRPALLSLSAFIIVAIVTAACALGFHKAASLLMPRAKFSLYDKGARGIVDYERYGEFINEGKTDYAYKMIDKSSLAAQVGEGVYPNTQAYKDPVYKQMLKGG